MATTRIEMQRKGVEPVHARLVVDPSHAIGQLIVLALVIVGIGAPTLLLVVPLLLFIVIIVAPAVVGRLPMSARTHTRVVVGILIVGNKPYIHE